MTMKRDKYLYKRKQFFVVESFVVFLCGSMSTLLQCHFKKLTATRNVDINCFALHCLGQTTKLATVNRSIVTKYE